MWFCPLAFSLPFRIYEPVLFLFELVSSLHVNPQHIQCTCSKTRIQAWIRGHPHKTEQISCYDPTRPLLTLVVNNRSRRGFWSVKRHFFVAIWIYEKIQEESPYCNLFCMILYFFLFMLIYSYVFFYNCSHGTVDFFLSVLWFVISACSVICTVHDSICCIFFFPPTHAGRWAEGDVIV